MSTATDSPPISQDYVSSCENLRLVRDPIRKKQLGEGTDFTTSQGETITFLDGRYTATDQELIEWLDGKDTNGVLFHKVGFGAEGTTADNSAELIRDIVKMAFSGEYQKIADILIAERSSYSRPDVISACETVLNEVNADPVQS